MNNNKKICCAEILCVGTELLLGDIVNTNAAFLSKKMAELGIPVYRQGVVGDNPVRLASAIGESLSRADLLIMSGGLGPTCDDLTKETAASFFGRKMYLDRPSLEKIEKYFTARSCRMPENNVKQAMMPEGAIIFKNDFGTAPALAIEGKLTDDGELKTVIMLPGPPRELQPVFENEVAPYLRERSEYVMVSRNINIFGLGESAVEEVLRDMMNTSENPTVAPYCGDGEVRLRVTARAASRADAEAMCARQIDLIKQTSVAKFIYDIDSPSIEDTVIRRLRARGLTLSCAESCTGGLISKRLTDIPGCSDVFMGGCVTYSNDSKVKLIGVDPATIAANGAVSAKTAAEMARGVRMALGTDVGISATGIAGPGGGTPDKPVGTVYIAISTPSGEKVRLLHLSSMRERAFLRTLAANEALAQIFDI
jgi:nicotinamide-nucleotide amidase